MNELKAYPKMPMLDLSQTAFMGIDHQALMNAHPLTNQAPGVDTSTPGTSRLVNEWGQPNYGYIAASQTVQGIMAYLRNKRKERDFRDYDRAQNNPLSQIPVNPNTTDASLYGEQLMKKGGPSPAKAAEMLRDGTANKKKLTAKQKKYFQCVKHGGCKKEEGGYTDLDDELEKDILSEPVDQKIEDAQEVEQDVKNEAPDESAQFINYQMSAARQALESEDFEEEPSTEGAAGHAPATIEGFKNRIARTEGAGYFSPTSIKGKDGKPASSAFGKYQFVKATRENVRGRFFNDMGKTEFEERYKTSPEFQEQVMDKYSGYLLNKYKDPKVAATAFFLGEGKAHAPSTYNPGGGNKSTGQYLQDAGFLQGGTVPFMKEGGIHIKKKNRGKFTDYCGGKVTAECIKKGKNSSNPTTRKRANFAANARKWHKEGGYVEGGTYLMTDNQLADLKKQGYEVE